jgi:peptidoglycan/xylan/chitin deacetylase (PgdA/CDA1 family)
VRPGITFDDGHVSHHKYAAPLLNEFGFQGTFFVTAGWIGTRAGYMNWGEVSDLLRQGHAIESHGWSHAFLTCCDDVTLRSELTRSKETIEHRLGTAVRRISMPGGRCNRRVVRACGAAGYTHVFNSNPFQKELETLGVRLSGRMMLRRTTTAEGLSDILAAEHHRFSSLRLQHGVKTGIRTIIGERLYQSVWEFLGSVGSRRELNKAFMENPNP